MQGKVDSRQHHEHHGDPFNRRAVPITNTGILGRKSADCDGGKGVRDGIKRVHACPVIGQATGHGERRIDTKQRRCGGHNAGSQTGVLHGPRGLRAVQLHATYAKKGQYRHRQDDDTDAPHPLQRLAIKQQ